LVLTLPPIDEVCCDDGSGANVNPCGRSAFARSRFGTPGFDPGEPVLPPDLEDAGHLGRHDDQSVADRRGASDEPGPRTSRDDRQAVLGRNPDARDDVVARSREGDERAAALDHRGVARVQAERQGVREHFARAERVLERSSGGVDVGHEQPQASAGFAGVVPALRRRARRRRRAS
jgi:hypothetical protein